MTDTSIVINDMPAVASAQRTTKVPGQRVDGSAVGLTVAQILAALSASDLTVFGSQILSSPGAVGSIASAAICDIGAETEFQLQVTGSETITSFGAVANSRKLLIFLGAVVLTHNGTSLILPGASNITTAAGDVLELTSDNAGNWRCVAYLPAAGSSVGSIDEATEPGSLIIDIDSGDLVAQSRCVIQIDGNKVFELDAAGNLTIAGEWFTNGTIT